MINHQHGLTCVLPPAMLERIAQHGNAEQRASAIRTLARDTTLRSVRAQNAILRRQGGRRLSAHAADEGGQPNRTVYDCKNGDDLTKAVIVRREGDTKSTGDAATDEAYDGLGATHTFFWDVLERNSIDGEGMPLNSYVHYGHDYDNAFWDGQEMVFGDGDGQLFNRFTISLDVIGHELTHGVTEDEAQLIYFRQAGALNESISDVFGSLVKQYLRGEKAEEADWLIGSGLIADAPDMALRSMKAPGTAYDHPLLGKDSQPAHMRDYVQTNDDNGGVHTNSGIPNHAFYLAATKMGGSAWESAGTIWYEALRDPRLQPTAQFRTFGRATLRAAQRLGFSTTSNEYHAVREAWMEVGLNV
jgi:Zn-dependent metalloprotease